jgi:transcriptional regulator with XRE-family HTH domain
MSATMANSLRQILADQVRQRRVELDWTQADLAAKAELRQSTISEIESASHETRLQTIERLAKALKCTPKDLIS